MAVYTKISKRDVSSLVNDYQINEVKKFQGIKKGIENTNYLLKTKKNKFILTIFEKRVQKKDLPFFMNLMEELNKKLNEPNEELNKNLVPKNSLKGKKTDSSDQKVISLDSFRK